MDRADADAETDTAAETPDFGGRRDLWLCLLGGLAGAGVAAFGLVHSARFFYTDDYQTYFMPLFREVARLIANGAWPVVTDRLWQGGAILAEYQIALFNPLSLGLYMLMARMQDAAAAAALYSLVHLTLFGAGMYFLCRALRCQPAAAMAVAVIAPSTEWILYWGATNWITVLVSIAWMPWALGCLVGLHRSQRWFVPAALTVAMVLTSGWPFGILALLVLVLVVLVVASRQGRDLVAWPVFRVLAALAVGGLLAAPAVLPLVPYLEFSGRPFDGNRWQAGLSDLAAVGLPFYIGEWQGFGDRPEIVRMPMVYVAWFVPVVLANAGWRRMLDTPTERTLLFLAVTFAVLSTLPFLGHFRWMFRLMQYYDLVLLVLVAVVLTRQARRGGGLRWRVVPTALAVLVPLGLAVQSVPELAGRYVLSALGVAALCAVSFLMRRRMGLWLVFALASNVAVVWSVNTAFVGVAYPTVPNQWVSPFAPAEQVVGQAPVRRITFFAPFTADDPGEAYWRAYHPGNTGLFDDAISVNGYSPFVFASYRRAFCFVHLAATACEDVLARVTRPVAPTGLGLLDLMRIDEVVIETKALAGRFRAATGAGWTAGENGLGGAVFTRKPGADSPPDPVSWVGEGLEVRVDSASAQRIVMEVDNAGGGDATMVLARAWYPGWRAEIDGRALEVSAIDGIMVGLVVPAGASGRLVLTYWPAGLWAGLWLAGIGALVLAVVGGRTLLRGVRERVV